MPGFFFLFPFLCMDSEDWTQVHTLVMLLLSNHVLSLSTEICSLAYNTVSIPIIWLWEGNNGIQSIKKCGLKWRDRSLRNESKAFIYNAKTLWGPKGRARERWGENCSWEKAALATDWKEWRELCRVIMLLEKVRLFLGECRSLHPSSPDSWNHLMLLFIFIDSPMSEKCE